MSEILTPEVIDERYTLLEELGKGGMGIVYKARNPKGEQVALKIIYPQIANSLSDRMFMNEAAITRDLRHGNIIRVEKYGWDKENNLLYMAMEFMPQGDLVNFIDRRRKHGPPLDNVEIIQMLRQIASGLDYLHRRKVVHRDLKPANILVDGNFVPKIADFGLAKNKQETFGRYLRGLGTLCYMPPEQFTNSFNVDYRADLYSFAAVIYEIICRFPPFSESSDPRAMEVAAAARLLSPVFGDEKIIQDFGGFIALKDPTLPTDINPNLPNAMNLVLVVNGMAKSPSDRYNRASELVDDVENALAGRPLLKMPHAPDTIGPVSTRDKERWSRQGRTLEEKAPEYVVLGAVLMGAGVGLAMFVDKVVEGLKKDQLSKEQRERLRVYRDVGELLADRLKIDLVQGVILAMQLIDNSGDDLNSVFKPGEPVPALSVDVARARRVLLSVHLEYRIAQVGKTAEIETEIFFLRADGQPARRVVTTEIEWESLPEDIRGKLLRKDEGYDLLVYGRKAVQNGG